VYDKTYYVYIVTNHKNGTLYVGVTSNLVKRIFEHKNKLVEGFSSKYNLDRLVYFVTTDDIISAIEKEKQMKKWVRQYKLNVINELNPEWKDLYLDII
jgi:putative endonuclease